MGIVYVSGTEDGHCGARKCVEMEVPLKYKVQVVGDTAIVEERIREDLCSDNRGRFRVEVRKFAHDCDRELWSHCVGVLKECGNIVENS